jgi:hypothetical protein
VHRDQRNDESFSLSTLIVGSVSSAAAAVVVHELWRTGTIIGAAAMPVLVALIAEALRRPAARISLRMRSPRWRLAALTGLMAFVLGAAGLTASEALLQRAVGDRDARTTLFDGGLRRSAPSPPVSAPAQRVAEQARPPRKPDRRAKQPSATLTPTPSPAPSPTPQPTPTATPEPAPQPIPSTDTKEVDH